MDNGDKYISITEIARDKVTQEQVVRICNRYYWAKKFCTGKDVVEIACGSGQGLGFLSKISNSFEAGDYSNAIISVARQHYGERIDIKQFDASNMPYDDSSKDIIIVFEAIYYFKDINKFIKECMRVLRPGGKILIASANKDLFDFNPSPYSYQYFGVVEFKELFYKYGLTTEFYGDTPINQVSTVQRILRPIKKLIVSIGVMPKTTSGKKILKRIVFGRLVEMPREITENTSCYIEPTLIDQDRADQLHKVIFCVASLPC